MVKTSKLMLAALAAWTIALAPPAEADTPAVVKQIPEDAQMFVAVPNLSALSQQIAQLNQNTGLNMPQLADPLTMVKAQFGLRQGLREDGGAAVAILSMPLPSEPGEKPSGDGKVMLLLPVSDYQAFVNNFNGGEGGEADAGGDGGAEGEGIRQIQWMGDTVFVKQAGDYAVLSDKRPVVAGYQAAGDNPLAERAGEFGSEVLSEAEAMVYVNLKSIAPDLRTLFKSAFKQAQQEMRQEMEGEPQAQVEMADHVFQLYTQAIDAVLRDAQAGLAGIDFADQGLQLSFTAQFEQGSDLAQAFQNAPEQSPSLNRLPDHPFLFAFTADVSPWPVDQWIDQAIEALPEKEENDKMLSLVRSSLSLWKRAGDTVQQAWYAPQMGGAAANPASLLNAVTVYTPDDPQAFIQQTQQIIQGLGEIELGEGISYKAAWQDDIMQVAGQQVDQFNIAINMPQEMMRQMGPLAMFFSQGFTYYITATDEAVITTTGADPAMLKAAIQAAGEQGGLNAAAGLQGVRDKLGEHRFAEFYIGVGTIMKTARGFMAMFNPDAGNWKIPENLPPIGAGFSAHGGGVAERIYIPTQVIRAIGDTARRFMGGGQNPPPAAARPGDAAPEAGAVLPLTDETFTRRVQQADKPVLVDFWADWCAPCREQAPIVSALAEEYEGRVVVGKIDVDASPQVSERYGVQAIPTLLIFKNGQVARKFVGLTPRSELERALKEVAEQPLEQQAAAN